MDFFSNRFTRVKYNGKTTKWRPALRNLPQGQTDSTILLVLFMNNVDLINVRNLAKKLNLTKGSTPTVTSTISKKELKDMYNKKYTHKY